MRKNLLQAIDLALSGECNAAHQIVQQYEDPTAAWIHAVLHKIEGDEDNSRYWYRRAGKLEHFSDEPKAELAEIRDQGRGRGSGRIEGTHLITWHMWRTPISLLLLLAVVQLSRAEERFITQEVTSRFLTAPRTVRIYLPPSYRLELNRRYPALYLHDGQNVFSSAGTNICFGWGSWDLDKTVDELCQARKMQEIILVAVDNTKARYAEYCGRHHSAETNGNTEFENYTAFLIRELKPKIDSSYRTRPEPANTGIMGSSLGGICSIVLAWEHPDVFGRAASLSGAFQVERTNFLNSILRPYQGKAKPMRLYLDSGVVDFTGGDDGQKLTMAVAEEFRRIGWGKELDHYVDAKPLTLPELGRSGLRRDKWAEAQTSQHNEFYWRSRAWRALTFLFPPAQ